MREVRIFGVILLVLLVVAYRSWTYEETEAPSARVTLWDVPAAKLEGIEYVTKTQTVAYSLRGDPRYGWFEVTRGARKRAFVANDKAERLAAQFAPVVALRGLGKNFGVEELREMGLERPAGRLTVKAGGQARIFDVGRTTPGAQDNYVRLADGEDVYLLAGTKLKALRFAQNQLMQRRILVKPLNQVGAVTLVTNGRRTDLAHNNPTDRRNAYWSLDGQDERQAELGSLMIKLSQISISDYPEDLAELEPAEPFLEVHWKGLAGEDLGSTTLLKLGDGEEARYYARSDRTVRPGIIPQAIAEPIEKDLPSLIP